MSPDSGRRRAELPHLEVALEIGHEVIIVPHGLLQDVLEVGLEIDWKST